MTDRPARAMAIAAESPFGPAPMTIASGEAAMRLLVSRRNAAGAAGLLVLAVAVRARPVRHLPHRIPRRRLPVRAAARRARPAARRAVRERGAVPRLAQPLLLGHERPRVP